MSDTVKLDGTIKKISSAAKVDSQTADTTLLLTLTIESELTDPGLLAMLGEMQEGAVKVSLSPTQRKMFSKGKPAGDGKDKGVEE